MTGRRLIGGSRVHLACLLAILLAAVGPCPAQDSADQAAARAEVIIRADRQAADDEVTQAVQQVLTDDPWTYGEHLTIVTRNGIVTLEGEVSDAMELIRIIRLCRKIPGARRVYAGAVEINAQLPDGG